MKTVETDVGESSLAEHQDREVLGIPAERSINNTHTDVGDPLKAEYPTSVLHRGRDHVTGKGRGPVSRSNSRSTPTNMLMYQDMVRMNSLHKRAGWFSKEPPVADTIEHGAPTGPPGDPLNSELIQRLILEQSGLEASSPSHAGPTATLGRDTRFEDFNFDELDRVELMMALEEEMEVGNHSWAERILDNPTGTLGDLEDEIAAAHETEQTIAANNRFWSEDNILEELAGSNAENNNAELLQALADKGYNNIVEQDGMELSMMNAAGEPHSWEDSGNIRRGTPSSYREDPATFAPSAPWNIKAAAEAVYKRDSVPLTSPTTHTGRAQNMYPKVDFKEYDLPHPQQAMNPVYKGTTALRNFAFNNPLRDLASTGVPGGMAAGATLVGGAGLAGSWLYNKFLAKDDKDKLNVKRWALLSGLLGAGLGGWSGSMLSRNHLLGSQRPQGVRQGNKAYAEGWNQSQPVKAGVEKPASTVEDGAYGDLTPEETAEVEALQAAYEADPSSNDALTAEEDWWHGGAPLPGSGLPYEEYAAPENVLQAYPWDESEKFYTGLQELGYDDLRSDYNGNIIMRKVDGSGFDTWDHEWGNIFGGVEGSKSDREWRGRMQKDHYRPPVALPEKAAVEKQAYSVYDAPEESFGHILNQLARSGLPFSTVQELLVALKSLSRPEARQIRAAAGGLSGMALAMYLSRRLGISAFPTLGLALAGGAFGMSMGGAFPGSRGQRVTDLYGNTY